MPASDAETVRGLIAAIDRYVRMHPLAADSALGIRSWWLSAPMDAERIELVEAALDELVRRGRLTCEAYSSGRVIYRRVSTTE